MEAPEAWVGKDARLRAEAAETCRTKCPVLEQCKAGIHPFTKPGPDDHGVWAGRDLEPEADKGRACAICGTVNRSTTGHHPRTCKGCVETKPCASCGEDFPRTYHSDATWERAKYCGHECARNGAKAAA